MTEAKHTPGPWSVEVDSPSGIGRTHAVYVCSAAGWPEGQLARVNVQDGLGEREANARLIAAAPELLATLKDACEEIERLREYANNHGGMIDEIEYVEGRSAIARAVQS